MTGRRRFRVRLALEGLVVVSSILLAFALDAWWDEHELDRDVAQELQSVRRERWISRGRRGWTPSSSRQHRDIGTRLPSYGTVRYPTDLETRNLVRHRASWLNSALGELRLLLADLERLLALIPAPEASR